MAPDKKGARRRGGPIVFLDETGFMLQPVRRRTWAPSGQTPVQRVWDRHDRLSGVGLISVSPRRHRLSLFFHLVPKNVDTDHMVWLLLLLAMLAASLVWRVRKRTDLPPPGFVLVGLAFLSAAAGTMLALLQNRLEGYYFWLALRPLLQFHGFILLPILGAGAGVAESTSASCQAGTPRGKRACHFLSS